MPAFGPSLFSLCCFGYAMALYYAPWFVLAATGAACLLYAWWFHRVAHARLAVAADASLGRPVRAWLAGGGLQTRVETCQLPLLRHVLLLLTRLGQRDTSQVRTLSPDKVARSAHALVGC